MSMFFRFIFLIFIGLAFQFGHTKFMLGVALANIIILLAEIRDEL